MVRFAQLASIALDNALLFESAQREVLERARTEAALRASVRHDALTGLPNREYLMEAVTSALDGAGERCVALAILDLDRFHTVNESLGHAVADGLLARVAARLAPAVRPTDTLARFGGDEYGVLLDPVLDGDDAVSRIATLRDVLRAPFELDDHDVLITVSGGVAVGQTGRTDATDLLREAEIALHRAKVDESGNLVLFDPTMRTATLERIDLERDLRHAIERNELDVHYQPIVDLQTSGVVGLEALARWHHPLRGLVPPLSFVPLAEETGLILPIGRWVLETACRQAREWQRRFPKDPPLVMSVNLSARQFAQPGLVDDVARILAETELDPSSLELEITESVVMDESDAGIARLRALRALGVRLVLDDFGTGYSSLAYLRELPLDTLKIDRSFVAGLGEDVANLPIVQAVIGLAHGLGIDVVAEGIESEAQATWVRDLACDRGQGFYYAVPTAPAELEAVLAAAVVGGNPLPLTPAVSAATLE